MRAGQQAIAVSYLGLYFQSPTANSASTERPACDLLVLNPPFSMGTRKRVPVESLGRTFRTSVAMAHVLRSLDLFVPKDGAVAIVPESLLFSDIDKQAREYLGLFFTIEVLAELKSSTFRGARANTVVVRLARGRTSSFPAPSRSLSCNVEVIRGGLPLFDAQTTRNGLSHVHSTDIRVLSQLDLSMVVLA